MIAVLIFAVIWLIAVLFSGLAHRSILSPAIFFLVGILLLVRESCVGREEIPRRLRRLLNIESGLNDGLALPIVLAMLAWLGGTEWHIPDWIGELILGVVLIVSVFLTSSFRNPRQTGLLLGRYYGTGDIFL